MGYIEYRGGGESRVWITLNARGAVEFLPEDGIELQAKKNGASGGYWYGDETAWI